MVQEEWELLKDETIITMNGERCTGNGNEESVCKE